jgi:Tfp pilus assembly protein PilX
MVTPLNHRQQGVALPVMLIILVVMLVSSIYLLKSSNSSTLAASNLAYDSALSKAADLGLHKGFQYIQAQALANKKALEKDDVDNGYLATYDTSKSVTSTEFWANSKTVTNPAAMNGTETGDTVEYVIHRACLNPGNATVGNACVLTSGNPQANINGVAAGGSLSAGSVVYVNPPQIHYIVTARIYGPRGGNVVNQMIVLIDA